MHRFMSSVAGRGRDQQPASPRPVQSQHRRRLAGVLGLASVAALVAGLTTLTGTAASAAGASVAPRGLTDPYADVATLKPPTIPGKFGLRSDIVYVDAAAHRVYLGDAANAAVDVWDTRTNRFIGAMSGGFTGEKGFPGTFDQQGPDGVLVDNLGQVWAGNGDGSVKVGSVKTLRETASIPTGSNQRADELAYDPENHIIIVTNPADTPAQVTLIGAISHRVIGHVVIPGAGVDSVEQPQWDPLTERFLVSVRETAATPTQPAYPNGEVAVIDPSAVALDKVLPLSQPCNPAGMAIGPDRDILLGCDNYSAVIMDKVTGAIDTTITQACCADEVWYNRADGRYYTANFGNLDGARPDPVVTVTNAETHRFITNIPIRGINGAPVSAFHAVAAGFADSHVYVPESDGVHVFVRVP